MRQENKTPNKIIGALSGKACQPWRGDI